MKVGILGRQPPLMDRALAAVRDAGHEAVGALDDAVMQAHLERRSIDALLIGGGVEAGSRERLHALGAAQGIPVLDVWGPDRLREVLHRL
jgi:hypothetical protein